MRPAHEGSGICFVRTDVSADNIIPADYKHVCETIMCTKLTNSSGVCAVTIEHLMAAFFSLGITNAIVELDGNEIPILDGSAYQFVEEITKVGVLEQVEKRKVIKITNTVHIEHESRWAAFHPSDEDKLSINIKCDYSKKNLPTDPFTYEVEKEQCNFANDIAKARTFGFIGDVEQLLSNKLALGASLDNVVVFDENGRCMNEGGLRFPDEPMRHKILDIIGDLALSNYYILGKFESFCPGHTLNNKLLWEVFNDRSNYEVM